MDVAVKVRECGSAPGHVIGGAHVKHPSTAALLLSVPEMNKHLVA
jgi:hypothetical protein